MYLTDFRERSLKDVITELEPGLFKKVTGLDVRDFELLNSIGVFNPSLMNDAIFKFKRYEDSSLSYTGIDKHENEDVGGWDTVIQREEYQQMFYNQQATMTADLVGEETEDEASEPVPAEKPAPVGKSSPKAPILVSEQYVSKPQSPIHTQPATPKVEYKPPEVKVGDSVKHKIFGKGEIVRMDKAGTHITVKFEGGEKNFIVGGANCAFKNGFLTVEK